MPGSLPVVGVGNTIRPSDSGTPELLQSVVTLEDRLRLQRLYTACNHLLYGGAEEAEAAGCAAAGRAFAHCTSVCAVSYHIPFIREVYGAGHCCCRLPPACSQST